MAATSSSDKTKKLQSLVKTLQNTYPDVAFHPADTFYWAPEKLTVFYNPQSSQKHAHWSLLHELAHALLGHTDYTTDLQLVLIEMEAWEYAKSLEQKHSSEDFIDDEHVQDCLDTYRDWLHARSSCPRCDQVGLQQDRSTYRCINCQQTWHISGARFKRPYRLCLGVQKETSPVAEADQVKFY